jgi:dTDP-4-dehydrorhamnose reductase
MNRELSYLILGKNGQLGKEFCDFFQKRNYKYVAVGRSELDITDFELVENFISQNQADVIINCAAYNLVDLAEQEKDLCDLVNHLAVKNLARICNKSKIKLIHFSSDYVFSSNSNNPLKEDDTTKPLNYYGMSKLAGEREIRAISQDYLIFRVSWLYGEGKQNFVRKFIGWCKNNTELNIANDEVSIPTSTKFVVEQVIQSLKKDLKGLYHLVPNDSCSRFEFAQEIVKLRKIDVSLKPVSKEIFNLVAERSNFSVLDNSKVSKDLNLEFREWRDYLRDYFS